MLAAPVATVPTRKACKSGNHISLSPYPRVSVPNRTLPPLPTWKVVLGDIPTLSPNLPSPVSDNKSPDVPFQKLSLSFLLFDAM